MAAAALQVFEQRRDPGWIYHKNWDLTLLIFSAVLVPLPLVFSYGVERLGWMSAAHAVDAINIFVAALIGGPHLFSTATLTLLDGSFRRRHRRYAAFAVLLPPLVLYLGLQHYRLLITFFFTWASLHVLHQILYLCDCYRVRMRAVDPGWSRAIDYGVILAGLYPVGLYKLSQGAFHVGGVLLPYPGWLRPLHLPELTGLVFGTLLVLWLGKSIREAEAGVISVPKTLLIGTTSVVSFFLPMGSNLDVLFQGYNTWHSFQYLFLIWWINRLRYARGELDSAFLRRIVRRGSIFPYYLCFLGATAGLVLLTVTVRAFTTLTPDQSYFVVVLSVLLVHYYFDHLLFTRAEYLR